METITRDASPKTITRNARFNYAKFCRAADSDSNVGIASMRRVTVRASRTRPGPAGAVNLRDAVQDHNHSLRAALDHGLKRVVKLLGGLADSEPAVNFQDRHSSGFANVDFHGRTLSHGGG
ncbi:MAG: hypothetical protein DMG47_20990 [Acidobacteria bacterium]|nr:MAG: hypothetical protein DMG47_20990 [Acidobacteriota bacterium]